MKQKILYGLISVVIAFCLWAYVITVVSPESEATYYDVPVVLNNESILKKNMLMLVSDEQPTVTLRLKGNRIDLNSLKKSDITLTADLSKISAPGQQTLGYSISFPGDFAENAFEILSYSPDRITLEVADWATATLDVEINCIGSVHADHIIPADGVTKDREQVTIQGQKSVIDKIKKAQVDVAVAGKTESINETLNVTLCDADGNPVDFDPAQVQIVGGGQINVGVQILRCKTVKLELDITYGSTVNEGNTLVEFRDENTGTVIETIKVAGTERQLESLADTLKIGAVDVSSLTEDVYEDTYTIPIPEGVVNLSGVTEVTVRVSFPSLKSVKLKLPVSSNMVSNLPAGLSVEDMGTLVCEVTFRGPETMINRLSTENVMLRVDLAGGKVGDEWYPAEILIMDFSLRSSIDIVGTYSILVRLATEPATP